MRQIKRKIENTRQAEVIYFEKLERIFVTTEFNKYRASKKHLLSFTEFSQQK